MRIFDRLFGRKNNVKESAGQKSFPKFIRKAIYVKIKFILDKVICRIHMAILNHEISKLESKLKEYCGKDSVTVPLEPKLYSLMREKEKLREDCLKKKYK